ncbi:hemoglobin [Candidatus Planktophila vernalis]|uniref:Hemoglobin n=1 Tax=Candidatus Planktophila vernalis TaxID=1884907 RepID=A0A249KU13_9ACTN|nr:globin [Candidatus Planktophila vernalis]ASY20256.1 hemoglobin [Candidatus Planktophila vernalis]
MSSLYEEIGGEAFFADLTAQFYAQVAVDPILRPMYPDTDLKAAAMRLQWFLEQYWGGPTTYQENRGHPRLRMRHSEFHINLAAHDAWLKAMRAAVDGVEMKPEHKEQLWGYLEMAAAAMINQPD